MPLRASSTPATIFEGLQLVSPEKLRDPKIRKEVQMGARLVYPNWTFRGKVVTFTGVNLARRAFGSATTENRQKALEIVNKLFGRFPTVRDAQQRITKQCEVEGCVRTALHYCLLSYGRDEDRMKQACAVAGSQPVANITKLALIDLQRKFKAGRPMRPILQIHDEIICEVPNHVPPEEAAAWLKESMEPKMPEMPGLWVPAEPSYGPNWAQQKKIKL